MGALSGHNVVQTAAAGAFGQHKGAGHTLFLTAEGTSIIEIIDPFSVTHRWWLLLTWLVLLSYDATASQMGCQIGIWC